MRIYKNFIDGDGQKQILDNEKSELYVKPYFEITFLIDFNLILVKTSLKYSDAWKIYIY